MSISAPDRTEFPIYLVQAFQKVSAVIGSRHIIGDRLLSKPPRHTTRCAKPAFPTHKETQAFSPCTPFITLLTANKKETIFSVFIDHFAGNFRSEGTTKEGTVKQFLLHASGDFRETARKPFLLEFGRFPAPEEKRQPCALRQFSRCLHQMITDILHPGRMQQLFL